MQVSIHSDGHTTGVENASRGRLPNREFWAKQRVFLTGHTGFKGSWLSLWLEDMGAEVYGFSLAPETQPNLFELLQPFKGLTSEIGDIRDVDALRKAILTFKPTIALHMAAQPLVRRSYRDPLETFASNVMGTANVLEALRGLPDLKTVLVITTDKVYRNLEGGRPFLEDDPLGGHDPYSASKAAAELVTQSWAHSFFEKEGVAVATSRAGNVVGGGDWSEDRLIPDIWRALKARQAVELRYPNATRPWQHVLEPLAGYLVYCEAMTERQQGLPTALNFGPSATDEWRVSQVADTIAKAVGAERGWVPAPDPVFLEMKTLSLDASLAERSLGWKPTLLAPDTLAWTAEWYRLFNEGADPRSLTLSQIHRYER